MNHPQVNMLLQRIHRGDSLAIDQLYAILLANNDDRAEVLGNLSVDMVEDLQTTSGYGTASGSKEREPDEPMVSGEKIAGWLLCQKALLLMGVRNEAIQ